VQIVSTTATTIACAGEADRLRRPPGIGVDLREHLVDERRPRSSPAADQVEDRGRRDQRFRAIRSTLGDSYGCSRNEARAWPRGSERPPAVPLAQPAHGVSGSSYVGQKAADRRVQLSLSSPATMWWAPVTSTISACGTPPGSCAIWR
jgi:hypothetical protein